MKRRTTRHIVSFFLLICLLLQAVNPVLAAQATAKAVDDNVGSSLDTGNETASIDRDLGAIGSERSAAANVSQPAISRLSLEPQRPQGAFSMERRLSQQQVQADLPQSGAISKPTISDSLANLDQLAKSLIQHVEDSLSLMKPDQIQVEDTDPSSSVVYEEKSRSVPAPGPIADCSVRPRFWYRSDPGGASREFNPNRWRSNSSDLRGRCAVRPH